MASEEGMLRQVQSVDRLTRQEHTLAALELGYPAVRFRKKVEGKAMGSTWNRRESDG